MGLSGDLYLSINSYTLHTVQDAGLVGTREFVPLRGTAFLENMIAYLKQFMPLIVQRVPTRLSVDTIKTI